MKIIECISELIEDEIEDAEHYVDLAVKWKEDYPDTADLMYDLSTEEMGHMAKLHEEVVALIQDYKDKNGEPPQEMMFVYNYLHKRQIDKAAKVRSKQEMYKA